jgi:hypothetical protein
VQVQEEGILIPNTVQFGSLFRRNLGKGIRLDLKGEGDVWLTVLGKHPIFVQSHFLDLLTERDEPEHAHKFVQYTTVKVGRHFVFRIFLIVFTYSTNIF